MVTGLSECPAPPPTPCSLPFQCTVKIPPFFTGRRKKKGEERKETKRRRQQGQKKSSLSVGLCRCCFGDSGKASGRRTKKEPCSNTEEKLPIRSKKTREIKISNNSAIVLNVEKLQKVGFPSKFFWLLDRKNRSSEEEREAPYRKTVSGALKT